MAAAVSDLYTTKLYDGYGEKHSNERSGLAEAYTCPWSDRMTYVGLLIDAQLSDQTNYPGFLCTGVDVSIAGFNDSGPNLAKLTATYADQAAAASQAVTHNWTYWTEHWEAGGEALTLGNGFLWDADKAPVKAKDASVVKIFPSGTITLSGVSSDLVTGKGRILDTIGKVNKAAVTIKGVSYAAETLLFLGADLDEASGTSDVGGRSVYKVALKFAVKHDQTWNQFWREDVNPPAFGKIVDSAGATPYGTAEFSDINPANW